MFPFVDSQEKLLHKHIKNFGVIIPFADVGLVLFAVVVVVVAFVTLVIAAHVVVVVAAAIDAVIIVYLVFYHNRDCFVDCFVDDGKFQILFILPTYFFFSLKG